MDTGIIIEFLTASWLGLLIPLVLGSYFFYQLIRNYVRLAAVKKEREALEAKMKDLDKEYSAKAEELEKKMKERKALLKK